jgi:copper chaperone
MFGALQGGIMLTAITLSVQGMTCGHCVKTVETSVGELPGVKTVTVDLKGARATVGFDPSMIEPEAIVERLSEEGYQASVV